MNVIECINARRSVRKYEDRCIATEDMDQLICLATKAATGSGLEPWGFVVINGKEEIHEWSEKIKQYICENIESRPYLAQYEDWMKSPKYDVFYRASTLLLICGNKESHWRTYDCSMAAANVMLGGYELGIGGCWIGFAEEVFNTEAFKTRYQIPANYEVVCTMTLGYMKEVPNPPKRKEPVVFYR